MFLKGNQVLENIDEGHLTHELEIAKFRNYGRENFSDLIKTDLSFKEFIVHTSQFYSINLPKEISEHFIRADIAPYFLLSDAPVLQKIEETLVHKSVELNFTSNFREIKKYFYNWLTKKTDKEKHFFVLSLKNSVERNYSVQSFYNLLLYGTVLTYDRSVYNPKRATELFDRAIEILDNCKIDAKIKDEVLYVVNLFKGFAHLKELEYLSAMRAFKKALSINSLGITAIFYTALSARYLDDFDTAYDYIKEVLDFDKYRFQFAINQNHLGLFSFFYNDAVFYNVFTEVGFAQLLPDIDFLVKSLYSDEAKSMQLTYSKLITLDNLRIKHFFDANIYKEIEFLKNALNHYTQKKHGIIRIVENLYRDKLLALIENIRHIIESHYFDQIKEEMQMFDQQIEQNKKQLERIFLEKDDTEKKIQMNLEEASEFLDESLSEKSKQIESKIEALEKSPKFNPVQVFYSSIVFTVITSIAILILVGMFTSMTNFGDEPASMQYGIRMGLKWGGVTFILGAIISIFTSLSSSWEKTSEKKALVSRLSYVKESEANERDLVKEDSEKKNKALKRKFENRIKSQEKIINNFIAERDSNYQKLYDVAKKDIEEYILPINNLLKTLNNAG